LPKLLGQIGAKLSTRTNHCDPRLGIHVSGQGRGGYDCSSIRRIV
jgi:hypothetical protein